MDARWRYDEELVDKLRTCFFFGANATASGAGAGAKVQKELVWEETLEVDGRSNMRRLAREVGKVYRACRDRAGPNREALRCALCGERWAMLDRRIPGSRVSLLDPENIRNHVWKHVTVSYHSVA